MLTLDKIEQNYPENLRPFKKNILREYLQYKILEIIFNSRIALKLSFLGGTALRILYDNARFSEDLDFDNFGMTKQDFSFLSDEIKNGLQGQGYIVEIKNVFKGAYRCNIRLPKILFDNKLSNLQEEKILIQVDTAPHNFSYTPDKKMLNKFDVFTQILATPRDILLSQKIYAVFNRKRAKGRDFFDIVFLLSQTKPNYDYLQKKLNISNEKELKKQLLSKIKVFDFNNLVKDVEVFLFNPKDSKKIKMFVEFFKQAELG
ncbi:MAG: nucleotidyl transferase AbiEii/AbiGii toxin family protein [Candidatus Falkowbacteria bacterium]